MAYPVQQQAKYWGVATAAFLIVLWYLGDVILPFVLGGAVAYFLDPVADRLEAWGLSRIMATVTITLVGILLFVIAILLVIPTLVEQTGQLINTAPDLFTRLQAWLTTKFPQLMDADSMIRHQLVAIGETIQSKGGDLINSVVSSAMSLVNVMVLIVVVPVVTFYLLLDWDNMVAKIDDLLPRDHAPVVRELASQIDNTLASFIRGQGTVCLVLGSYYAISLMLVGLNFGLVVGFIAGLITFIPYIGALVGGTLAIGLALFQFWGEWGWIAAVGGIFVLGQFLEGNVLTPKLVGKSVGLQPVWLLFALAVFGSSFGFVGMLVAVPVAAMLGVVARFGIAEYKKGRLYKGFAEED
ncbi:MAG: AI-2E family transporter [Octadecabacter sp.]